KARRNSVVRDWHRLLLFFCDYGCNCAPAGHCDKCPSSLLLDGHGHMVRLRRPPYPLDAEAELKTGRFTAVTRSSDSNRSVNAAINREAGAKFNCNYLCRRHFMAGTRRSRTFAEQMTPGIPAPGWVPAPARKRFRMPSALLWKRK